MIRAMAKLSALRVTPGPTLKLAAVDRPRVSTVNLLERKGALYASAAVGLIAVSSIAVALFAHDPPKVNMSFYAAAAQVIPILILAQVVRLWSVRDYYVGARARLIEIQVEVAERLEEAESKVEPDSDTRRAIDVVNEELPDVIEAAKGTQRRAEHGLQVLVGMFIGSLVISLAGTGASLVALAQGHDTPVIIFLTIAALGWLGLGLIYAELINFTSTNDRRRRPRQG